MYGTTICLQRWNCSTPYTSDAFVCLRNTVCFTLVNFLLFWNIGKIRIMCHPTMLSLSIMNHTNLSFCKTGVRWGSNIIDVFIVCVISMSFIDVTLCVQEKKKESGYQKILTENRQNILFCTHPWLKIVFPESIWLFGKIRTTLLVLLQYFNT